METVGSPTIISSSARPPLPAPTMTTLVMTLLKTPPALAA
jgi:hypothetical protein